MDIDSHDCPTLRPNKQIIDALETALFAVGELVTAMSTGRLQNSDKEAIKESDLFKRVSDSVKHIKTIFRVDVNYRYTADAWDQKMYERIKDDWEYWFELSNIFFDHKVDFEKRLPKVVKSIYDKIKLHLVAAGGAIEEFKPHHGMEGVSGKQCARCGGVLPHF